MPILIKIGLTSGLLLALTIFWIIVTPDEYEHTLFSYVQAVLIWVEILAIVACIFTGIWVI